MDLPDNNVLISAFRPDAQHHAEAKNWLEGTLNQNRPLRLFPTVEAGFLRVVTHPRIFGAPSTIHEARGFLEVLCSSPSVEIAPWTPACRQAWAKLCVDQRLQGNDCNDAMLAALALERSLRVVTFDQGFRRFKGIRVLILGTSV